jgi:TRAP-type C4-dicarboxylate transport system permease small subunit
MLSLYNLPADVAAGVDIKYVPVINGLITVSGILFAFLVATAVRDKQTPKIIYLLLCINVVIFYYLAANLFLTSIWGTSFLGALAWSMVSFNSNFVTGGSLVFLYAVQRIRKQQRQSNTTREDEQKQTAP